jgi:hypothetical protein
LVRSLRFDSDHFNLAHALALKHTHLAAPTNAHTRLHVRWTSPPHTRSPSPLAIARRALRMCSPNLAGIGSGGVYALSAARALVRGTAPSLPHVRVLPVWPRAVLPDAEAPALSRTVRALVSASKSPLSSAALGAVAGSASVRRSSSAVARFSRAEAAAPAERGAGL